MEKYKIVSTMIEHLDKDEAASVLLQLQTENPGKKLEVQKYNWSPEEKRLRPRPRLALTFINSPMQNNYFMGRDGFQLVCRRCRRPKRSRTSRICVRVRCLGYHTEDVVALPTD